MEVAERETTIQWSDVDGGVATVFTAQRPMVTRLRRLQGAKRVDVHRTKGGLWLGETWEVPVASVVLRNPPRLSEAQRQALRERGRRSPVTRRAAWVAQNSSPRPRISEPQGSEGTQTPSRPFDTMPGGNLAPLEPVEVCDRKSTRDAGR